jgi:hypothetical protein
MSILTIACSKKGFPLLCITSMTLCMPACSDNPWKVDIRGVELSTPWEPMDLLDLLSRLPQDSLEALTYFQQKTDKFGTLYVEDILRIGPADSYTTIQELKRFTQHPEVYPIAEAIDSISGTSAQKDHQSESLENAFKRFHVHFPEVPIPKLVWMNSGFNHAVYPTAEYIAIGLEWFLGKDHPIIQTLPPHMFPAYQRNRMEPERTVATAMRGWLLVHFSDPWYAPENCADELLFWGKSLFILEQLMPEIPPHILMDWSKSDWDWAVENERQVWVELQPQEELFESNRLEYGRWFNEGPFTRAAAIPQESPDRLGAWIGRNAIRDFMKKHPETSLAELLHMNDPLPILKAYRPNR